MRQVIVVFSISIARCLGGRRERKGVSDTRMCCFSHPWETEKFHCSSLRQGVIWCCQATVPLSEIDLNLDPERAIDRLLLPV